MSFPLRDFRMPSGLRVVVERDERSPVVAMVTAAGAGHFNASTSLDYTAYQTLASRERSPPW
ncbi:hypothetical protein [Corallococcus sicarius]|uniref:hypothetical protein n=1 Tax=Corallococcus sicarius TaxID=2316726 RepID=UPI001FC924D5|nr:hypothetical protein [Corallococcus sicarius]